METQKSVIRNLLTPQQSVDRAAEILQAQLEQVDRLIVRAKSRADKAGKSFSEWDFLANLYALNSFDLTSTSFLSPLEQLAFDEVADYADGAQVEPVGDLDFYVLKLHREDLDGSADGEVSIPLTSFVSLFDQAWAAGGLPNLLSDEVARRVGVIKG